MAEQDGLVIFAPGQEGATLDINCNSSKIPQKTKKRTHCVKGKVLFIILIATLVIIALITVAIIYGINNNNKDNKKTNNKKHTEPSTTSTTLHYAPWKNMRLPDSIVPKQYDIKLDINMDTNIFTGLVTIEIMVTAPTRYILFHKVNLNITNVHVEQKDLPIQLQIIKQFSYKRNEFYVIETNPSLLVGKLYMLNISFAGIMSSDLSGLYTSVHKWKIASTFFSPISARKAIPCFDEPKFKANFTLTLTHSKIYHALGNMPIHTKTYKNDLVTTKFYPTEKMSTYILCWVISQFENINMTTTSGVLLRAWGYPDKLEGMRYGLENTAILLSFYEDYFNISFPLKKLDIVSIPGFSVGAMENWGLITYQSALLQVKENVTTETERQNTFIVTAHELVHQWFGNLATMKFWTDAWLKEGKYSFINLSVCSQMILQQQK